MNEESLLGGTVAINQFRNSIYELIVALKTEKKYELEEIVSILKEMGKNIANIYFKFWKTKSNGLEHELKEIYQSVFGKKVKITIEQNKILVSQKNCPFCKYVRDDAGVAGCNIIVGLIEQYSEDFKIKKLKGSVISSKTLGEKKCIHQFTF
ncbi:MAG: hypothetical protein ACTSRG_06535 [Candidatus Helarchaeota archaeon]